MGIVGVILLLIGCINLLTVVSRLLVHSIIPYETALSYRDHGSGSQARQSRGQRLFGGFASAPAGLAHGFGIRILSL